MRKVYSFSGTKQFVLLLITCLFIIAGIGKVTAQTNAGIYDSYIKINGTAYYLGYSGTIPPGVSTNQRNAPAFNGTNFGSFGSGTLTFTGGIAYTWRATSGGLSGNICGSGKVYYTIYKTGTAKPPFTGQQMGNNGTIKTVAPYYFQKWFDTTSANTDLLAGLDPGNYTFEVYIDVNGSQTGSDCNTNIYANGLPGTANSNYIATFTIKGAACPPSAPTGNELVTNGNFDAGSTGFTTGYTNQSANTTSNSLPNQYVIGNAALMKAWNNSFNISGDASGNANGNFMGVDGNRGLDVWSETFNVTPNTIYILSFYSCGFGGSTPAQLYFYADNTNFGSAVNTPTAATWSKFSRSWCSGSNTTITIHIRDTTTNNIGNDFGLDSLSFRSSNGYTNISAGRDTTVCSGNPVLLNPTNGACTYTWVPAIGLSDDSIATPLATPTITTTYTLYAVVPGCTSTTDTSKVVVTVSNGGGGNLNVTANPSTICLGQQSTLAITNGSGAYQWSPSASLTNSTGVSTTASPTITTTYTVTNGSGSCASTGSVTVTVLSGTGGALNITAVPSSICTGQNSTLTITNGSGGYQWSPALSLNNSTGLTATASPTITTTYTVTNGTGSCASTGNVTVTVLPGTGLPLTVTASPDSICIGQNSTLSITNGSGVYQWSPSVGLSNSTGAIISVSPTLSTTYSVTTGNGACASTGSTSVYVSSATGGTLTVTANPSTICPGDNSTLSIASGSGSYTWSPASSLSNSTSATTTASPTATTVYNVKAPGGTCAATGQVTLTVANNTKGGNVKAIRDTICQNTPGNLNLINNTSNVIQWQSSPDKTIYTDISGASNASYKTTPLQQSTWYHAIVGTGHCTATSDSLLLYVPPALVASFNYIQAAGKQLNFNSDSSAGSIRSYHWDFGDGQTSSVKNPTHTFAKDSTYYVCLTLYDGSNCSYTYCRYSSISDAVRTLAAEGNWVIYPNPFSGQLTVSSKQLNGTVQSVNMYDVLGQLVINKNISNTANTSVQLDVSSLAKGMYFVIIKTANADYVQKVVKQ